MIVVGVVAFRCRNTHDKIIFIHRSVIVQFRTPCPLLVHLTNNRKQNHPVKIKFVKRVITVRHRPFQFPQLGNGLIYRTNIHQITSQCLPPELGGSCITCFTHLGNIQKYLFPTFFPHTQFLHLCFFFILLHPLSYQCFCLSFYTIQDYLWIFYTSWRKSFFFSISSIF